MTATTAPSTKTPKTYTKSDIVELLMTNDRAVGRALVVLYGRQTSTEKEAQCTILNNGVGFTGADARRPVTR